MTSEVDKILARVAQVAENNPIARDIFEQKQAVGQQLPEGMQPHPEYRFNPTTDALESTESDGRFMTYADGMDSLKDVGLGGLKGGIGLLDLGLTTVDAAATQLKNGTRFIGDVGTGTPMKPSEYNVNDNSLRKLLLDSGVYDKKNVREYYADKGSDAYKLAEARIQAKADNEESDWGKFYVGASETLKDPTLGVPMVTESLPATFGGGMVGRGIAKVAPILGDKLAGLIIPRAGALGEGAMASGMALSDLSAQKAEQGEGVTLHDARYIPAVGAGTYAFGRSFLFNNSLDIESALANGVTKTSIVGLAPNALKEAAQEAGQGYTESVFNQMTLNNGEVDFGQAAYDAGRSSASGVYMSGMMAGPSALANTPSAISQGAGKVKQQFQVTHDDLTNPAYKKFNPAQAYANAQTAFNKATTPEQQQQATEQMRQAEEAIYTGVSKFDELINNETDETKKKKLEESKNKWLNSQVTTLNTITDAVQSEQDEGFSASSILDNYSKLGAIQAQQEQAQAQTNTNTDVDLSQVDRPTGDMVTPNTQATQTTKPNGYVKGKPVAIMGSYALKSDGKHRDTGAGTGDHYDIRLASDSKTGAENGHRDNPVGYLNRFITSDGESLANAGATSGYAMRNGRMHWGLDFGANGSFKQNQAKRTLLIAPEWEDRVVSLETRKDNVKYDKNGNRTDGGYYTRVTFDDGAVLHILHQDAKGQAQLKQAHGNATTNQQTNPVQATSTTVNSSWQGKKHRNISNNTTYDSKMSSIYSQYGFTLAEQQILKAQVGQESGFDAKAKNVGSGAFGLTQFIEGTAKRFGVKPNDVDSMLHGQAKYMRYLLDRYKGDWAKALAGYNTGEGNVDAHWGKDGTGNGGGVMTTKWNRGNGETLLYVENILANAGAMTLNGQGGNTDTVNSNTIQGSIDTTEQTNSLNDLLAQMDNETNTENLQKLQEQVNQLQEQIANTANTTNTTNTTNTVNTDSTINTANTINTDSTDNTDSTQPEATQEQQQYAEQVEPQIIRRYSRMALDGDIDQAKAEIQQFQQAGVLSEEKANSLISLLDIKASIKSNTMSGVSGDIYNGSKHGDTALENNLGLKDYERVFSSGNQKTTNQYMDYLENFRDNHNAKSSSLQQALAEFNTTGKDQYVGRTTDGWQFITQEQYENKSANETAYQINGRSQKLVNAVTNEAKAIDSFTNNWQTILNQKGNKPVQQNNNQQQQSQPKPVEPSTDVPTVPTVPTTPKPISNTNTNSAYAKTAQEMNDPNGVWVGRNGYGKDTVSMSQVDGSTQPYIGMFGSPFNESGSHGWVLNDDGSPKTKEEVRQLHIQKYKEKLAEYYSHSKKKWFRDAVESLRDKTLHTGMRNSSSAVEVQAISQFLEETKDMNDEEKLAYARALSQGGRDTANAIKSGKLDNTVSNRLGNTNTNTNSNQQQQEPVFDETDTLNFGDSNNQQSMPEPTFNENDSLNFADDYDDVQQQLASRDDNDADIELNFGDAPIIDSDEVIIDLDDVQETNDNSDTDTSTDTDNDIVLGKDNDTGIDITKGVHTLLDMIEHIAFTDIQLLIANAVANKYPDRTISFDGSNADISIKTTNPETVLARLVYLATRDVLSKDPTTSKAHESAHKSLDYVINKLSQYKTTDPKEQELIQNLLQSKEALVALGTSHKEYIDLLKSIKTEERKVKNNLFSVIIHGFMSFLGVPSKATTTNLFEVLMAGVGKAINLQAQDNKSYVLSMVSDSATRKKEQDKPFDEQNLITSSFTQSTKGNLVNVKSLSSRLIQKGIKEIKRLGVKAPNEKQEAQLKHYLKFEQQFKQALYNTFQSKKDEYKYQDLKQFLNIGTNENPVFDDNAITAMALSAYDYIALNGGNNYTSAEDIAVLLGLDKEALVPNYVLFKYKDAGISVNEVIIDLGKNAVKSLGLTAIDTAPAETLQRLESSIGDWILTTMLENKLAYKNIYSQQELENDRANTLGHIPKELNAHATKSTITLKPLVNELDQVIDDITELTKGTSGYLSSLYGSSTRRRSVSLVPIEETIDKIDSTSSEVPKSQMEVIERTQKEPIKLNQGMSSLLDYFLDNNEEMLHIMFGAKVYTEEELAQQGVHISERESMIKSSEGNLKALDSYLDLKEGLPTRDTVFYDQIKTVKNGRMHYNSNVLNFQSEKVHRALAEYAPFETEYNSKDFINQKWTDDKGNPTAEAYHIRAIFENAEGTEDIFEKALKSKNLSEGYTVDKLSTENFMPIAWKYLTTNRKLKTAIRGIHNIQDGKKPTELQLKAIQEVVAQWEMGANSFRALMEVANLHRAIQNNTTFVSSLGLGSDGVNNGTSIGMVQMGINDALTLQRLGLFGYDADNQTYFDTRNDTTIGDYYTAFKDYLLAEVDNLADETDQVDVLHALRALNTSLETRKMLKAILIPFGYGAGYPRLIRASAEQMIKDVYKSMSKIANEQDRDKATTAYNNLTTQLQSIFGDRFKLPPINELLEYEFNNKDYALLLEAYEVIMGEAISKAVKKYAKEFIERRNFNVNIHNAISETYVKAREHLLEQAKQKHEAKLREEYKDATENELKRVLAYNTLSTQDIYEQVDKPLQKMFATVRTRHQVEDDLESGSIEFVKPEKTFRQDISIQAITQIFNPKNKSNKDKTNQNVFIRDKVLTTTGVTPNAQMTQQQDAYVTSKAMVVNDEVSINVHDADIGKPTHYPFMAQAQNRAFFEGTAQYHMYSESIEALVSMIENITEVMGKDYVTSDVAIGLIESLLVDVPNVNTTGDLIQTIVNNTITRGLRYDRGKITLLGGLGSIHQYAGEGGQVKLTDKDYEMLNEQRDVINQHEEQLRKRIAKVSKEFKHELDYHDETNQPVPTDISEVVIYGDWAKNPITAKGNINQAINALGAMFPNKKHSEFHAKKYIEVVSSDAVYVVAPINGNATVYGDSRTTVNIAKKLDKPLYVYDTITQTWHKYQPVLKRFVSFNKPVVLTPKAVVTGKKAIEFIAEKGEIELSPTFKTDIRLVLNEVTNNTITAINDRATYEQAKQLINTLSKQDKDKLRDTVAKHLNKDNPSLKQVTEYVMEFGLPSQNLPLDTLTEQAIEKGKVQERQGNTNTNTNTTTSNQSNDSNKPVNIYYGTNENAELSNLAFRPFTTKDGTKYYSVEHYYQTNKTGSFNERLYNNHGWVRGGVKILGGIAGKAKTDNGYNITLMKEGITLSFEQNPKVLQALLATGDRPLTHRQDTGMWGRKFPELLMEVREELANIQRQSTDNSATLDTLTEQAIDNLTDDEVSATYEQNKEAIQELLQQDLLYQLDASSGLLNIVLSKDTLGELAKLRSHNIIRPSHIRDSALPTSVKQYLTALLSSRGYKRLSGKQLLKALNNSYTQHQRIKQLDHELERRLVSMVKSLGYTVSVKTKQELKDKYGLGINGVFSVVQKSIEVVRANERNITTLPEEALHAIIEVANWKDNGSMLNTLYMQLRTWSEYPKIYNRYASIYTRNGTPDKTKIHKEIMAQVLSYAITGHKDFKFYSIEYIDDGFITSILKKFIDLIGRIYDDFTLKGVDRELRKTASIIADYLKEGNLDGIVHSRTTKGNLLNVENTLSHQRTIDNGFGEKLIQDISSLGGVITGSFGLRYFNSIFREAKDSLHDIDLYLDIKKELKATRYRNLRPGEFENTNFFKELSKQYPHLSFAVSFGEKYNNQIYQYVVTKDTQTKALIDQAIEQLKSQRKRVGIDTVTELLPEDKANQFYWLDIFIGYDIPNTFDSKLGMNFLSYEKGIAEKNALGRSKDANDYMNSHAMDTGNYIDSYFQVDETEIEYKRRILKEAVRRLHNLNTVSGVDETYENAKALVDTLDNETKDKLRAVVKEIIKVDNPTYKQVAQYVVQYALNTVQDVVEHLNPSSELSAQDKLYHYLWQRVQQLNPNLRVVTRDDFPDSTEEGYYDPVENIIYLNKKVPDDQKIRVLNHEIFHALTETGLTQDTQAGRELKAIYNYLKGKANGKFTTQLQDINEFVAYAMTDKVFMDWVVKTMDLKEIGIKAKLANKLQYFVGVVMRALGLSKYKSNVNTLTQLINDVMVEYDPDNIGNVTRHSQRQEATARVNSTNTLDIFKNLPTNVSEAHNEHLNYVVDNIIGTYQNTHSKPMVNIANGKLRNTSLLNGFKSSDKEAYITDALIIVSESYLKAHTGSMAVNGLDNLYRDAIKQYASVKDLFPNFATASKEDKAQMVKMYNFIFNNKTKQDNVARFMAMTLANEQFRQLMQSGKKPMRDNTTWFGKAMRVLDKVVNWFNRVYFMSKSNKHSDITDAMTKRLVYLDIKARNTSVDWLQVGWTKALEFTGKALDKPVKKLGYLLMDKVIKQFEDSTGKLGTLGGFAKLQSNIKTLKDLEKEDSVVNKLLTKTYGDERYKIIRDTLNEVTMYGKRGKWIENMIRLTQSIGKVRQAMKESTIRVLDEVFESPLTKEQKSDITKVVLRTELSSLVRHGFSIEKVASMFEQVTLNKTIDNYAKQLIKKVGYTKANDMLMQSKALGYYMAKESTVRNMTKSAQGIAIGLGTDYQTDFSNMDNDVFMLVDVLSTLYALGYTDKSTRQSVKALLENEPLAMNTVLQLQKGLVDKGRDEFEHNPLNYQKGYTPQITNPYRKLIWVTTPDEIKMLKAQGFEEVTKLTKDKLDDTDRRTLMLHTAYSPNNYVSGGLDLADSHARGTTVYKQGINDREIVKVTKANIAVRKQRNQGSYMNYDPSVDRNVMVATYATDGAILDYHYEMEGNTRDTYLERDNSFDELMGTLQGNLEFKPQIREHQANIAKEIFREAKANFAKDPNEFVLLDFDNPDPVVQETMKLLPYSFRKEIIKHFGDGVVPVHKSVYTSMFGFRAYSIANMFDKLYDPEQKLNRAEKLITGIFRAFSKEKARQSAVQLEKLIQDFMSVIKDYIVVRSGGVLMGNIISNILLLSLHGVNPIKILQDSIFAWRNSNRYTKTQAKVNDLNTRLLGLTNKQEIGLIKRELKTLQRELDNNPMHEFMQAGLMSTIVEDLTNQDNKYKTPIQVSKDKYLNKIPGPIRSTFSTLSIDKGTLLHNFLSDAVQFSDLSAKYVLTKHNMDKGMDISNAIYESQINFINYDMPTNQFLDYMNRMGFMIFTKFFLRFQQVMLKLFNKMPVTALAQHYAIEQLGGQGIYEPFIFSRFGNPFDDSIFMADNAFADAIITDLVF